MARKEIPDFILTDVTMPVMDGLSMIHEIEQDTTLNNIPVMILSAKASVKTSSEALMKVLLPVSPSHSHHFICSAE